MFRGAGGFLARHYHQQFNVDGTSYAKLGGFIQRLEETQEMLLYEKGRVSTKSVLLVVLDGL